MFRSTKKRTLMGVLTMFLIAGMAIAQAPQPASGGGDGRSGSRVSGRRGGAAGKIVAISSKSISVLPPANPNAQNAPTSVTTAIPATAKFQALTASKIADLKTGSFATVRGFSIPDSGEINANAIIVLEKAPADTAGTTGVGQTTGMLAVADGKISLKSGDATLNVVSTENTVVYTAKDATAADAKVGGNALLTLTPGAVGAPPTLLIVNLLPEGEIPAGLTGGGRRGGGRGAAPAPPAAPGA